MSCWVLNLKPESKIPHPVSRRPQRLRISSLLDRVHWERRSHSQYLTQRGFNRGNCWEAKEKKRVGEATQRSAEAGRCFPPGTRRREGGVEITGATMEETHLLPTSLFKTKREEQTLWLLPSSHPPFSRQALPLAALAGSQSARELGKRSLRGSEIDTELTD